MHRLKYPHLEAKTKMGWPASESTDRTGFRIAPRAKLIDAKPGTDLGLCDELRDNFLCKNKATHIVVLEQPCGTIVDVPMCNECGCPRKAKVLSERDCGVPHSLPCGRDSECPETASD